MVYEDVSFNIQKILSYTCEAFITERSYQHLWPTVSQEVRQGRLKDLHQLCVLWETYISPA